MIGIRRSRPNARGVILIPGGAWRRLYSARSTSANTRSTASLGQAGQRELVAPGVLLDVGLEDRVERVVVGQRVLVLLVRPQLGAGRALDDRARDRMRLVAPVAVVDEPVDERLRHVLDDREAAGRVAVERRVADRVLRLVAGREHEPAELVRQRHQQVAADPRLQVLLGDVRLAALEDGGQHLLVDLHRRRDRHVDALDAEVRRQLARVALGPLGRVARRHHDRRDPVGAERVRRDQRHERGVDPAREPEHDVLEAVLARSSRARRGRARRRPPPRARAAARPRRPSAPRRGGLRSSCPRWRTSGSARRTGGRSRVSRSRAVAAACRSTVQSVSASANWGARASTVPSWSSTTEWPSKTSSSWPPTALQNATALRLSRARWTSIASRSRPLPA